MVSRRHRRRGPHFPRGSDSLCGGDAPLLVRPELVSFLNHLETPSANSLDILLLDLGTLLGLGLPVRYRQYIDSEMI